MPPHSGITWMITKSYSESPKPSFGLWKEYKYIEKDQTTLHSVEHGMNVMKCISAWWSYLKPSINIIVAALYYFFIPIPHFVTPSLLSDLWFTHELEDWLIFLLILLFPPIYSTFLSSLFFATCVPLTLFTSLNSLPFPNKMSKSLKEEMVSPSKPHHKSKARCLKKCDLRY